MDKGYILFSLGVCAVGLVVFSLVVLILQFLWNYCVSPLGVAQVGFFQMAGLFLLAQAFLAKPVYKVGE